jgi:hypothetical protein
VQTLQVQLHTAVPAKTKAAPAAALTFTNIVDFGVFSAASISRVDCPAAARLVIAIFVL